MPDNAEKLLGLVNTVRDFKGLDPLERVEAGMNLRTDLGLDSLDLAELAVRIEAATGEDVFRGPLPHSVGDLLTRMGGDAR